MAVELLERDLDETGPAEGREENKQLVRLLVGSGMLRRRRIRNLLLAHLLSDREDDADDGESVSREDRQLVRLLVAGGIVRRRRVRRLLLAHLLREKIGRDGEDPYLETEDGEGGDEDRQLVRLLIAGGIMRGRRIRRLLLAHLLRNRAEERDEDDDIDGGTLEDDEDRRLARLLIAAGGLRRRRMRRLLLAHLLSERGEGEADGEDVGEDEDDEDVDDDDRRLARLLLAGGVARRRRMRRLGFAELLRK